MSAGELAARYDVSDSDDDFGPDSDDEAQAKENAASSNPTEAKDFDWDTQLGGHVSSLQEENSKMKAELDSKKAQVKKLGIMLHALDPIPGVDAEKLLNVVNAKKGEHHDLRDEKIVSLAKKVRQLTFELNKERANNKKATEALLMMDGELDRKNAEIESLCTPAARAMIAKTIVNSNTNTKINNMSMGGEGDYGGGVVNSKETKKLHAAHEEMRNKFEIMKERNRQLEHKLLQEVGGEGEVSERLKNVMHDGWRGRAQQGE